MHGCQVELWCCCCCCCACACLCVTRYSHVLSGTPRAKPAPIVDFVPVGYDLDLLEVRRHILSRVMAVMGGGGRGVWGEGPLHLLFDDTRHIR